MKYSQKASRSSAKAKEEDSEKEKARVPTNCEKILEIKKAGGESQKQKTDRSPRKH